MSQQYQFNFDGMARMFDDIKYIVQKGGAAKLFGGDGESFGEKFLTIVTVIAVILVLIVVLKIAYNIIFHGYMRFAMPALYHKEDMDGFIRKNNILIDNYKTLLLESTANKGCSNPYITYDMIFGKSTAKYKDLLRRLDSIIKQNYNEYKYDDQIYEAFKDFYLYYNKIDVSHQTVEKLPTANGPVEIRNKTFYEQMLGYFISKGLYHPEKKSDDQQLIDIYNLDKKNNFKYYNRIVNVKSILDQLAGESTQLCNTITSNPYTAFIVLPENDMDIQAAETDLQKYHSKISDASIYSLESTALNDYSWYIIEYQFFMNNPNAYNIFKQTIMSKAQYSQDEVAAIRKYINITPTMKKFAESKIFSKTTPAFFEFVKKHPIFCHIYFTKDISDSNKPEFYNRLMQIYDTFGKCGNSNLLTKFKYNGQLFLTLIKSIMIFDLYINRYKPTIMKTYQDQNYANKFFFSRLFDRYMEDFVKNRMGNFAKKTFSNAKWNESFRQFSIVWNKLGQMIRDMMKSIFKSFHTTVDVEKPQGENPDS